MPTRKSIQKPTALPTLPELDQSKKAVLDTLVSKHSQRAYKHAIDAFIVSPGTAQSPGSASID